VIQQPFPWQSEQWQLLQQRLTQGRLPHALLLHGATGMGKQQFAQAAVNSLLCEQRGPKGLACGECRGCQLFTAGNHPDFSLLMPDEVGKAITVDKVRSLASKQANASQYGGFKVILIMPAEQMNIAAANSLLKTLEEPTPNTVLILVCSHIDRLLPTIRSRCQRVLFSAPQQKQALAWLNQQTGLDSAAATQLLALADYAPLRAKQLAESEILAQRADTLSMLQAMARGELTPLQVAEQGQKLGTIEVLLWLSGWSMDMIRLKFSEQPCHISSPDVLDRLRPLAQQIDLHRLYEYFDKLIESSRLARTQVNQQLLLEDVLIGWVRLFAKRRR